MWHLGFDVVPENEAWVVEKLGRFQRVLNPGLTWLPWWLYVAAGPETGQYTIRIFASDTVAFDFVDGALTVKGAEVIVQIKSPRNPYLDGNGQNREGAYRVAYFVTGGKWQVAAKNLVENTVRGFFNNIALMADAENVRMVYPALEEFQLDPETGDRITRPFVDPVPAGWSKISDSKMAKLVPGLRDGDVSVVALKRELDVIGLVLLRITFEDFEPSAAVMEAREAVARAKANATAAEFVADQRNTETMGTLLRMYAATAGIGLEELTTKIEGDSDLQAELRELSRELITRRMSLDSKALTDIRVNGSGDVGNFLVTLASILKNT